MNDPTLVLQTLNRRFTYRRDTGESWRILKGDGPIAGDCEDYALTLVWLCEGRSMLRFWWALFVCRYVLWYCLSPAGNGHVALWIRGRGWTDNIQRRVVPRLPEGYRLRFPCLVPVIALKFALRPVLTRF